MHFQANCRSRRAQRRAEKKFTGDSARVSGAQHLAKANIELWRIQLFGRWSSEAFLRYIRDAPLQNLHSLANEASLQQSIQAAKSDLQRLVLGRDISEMKNQFGVQLQATQEMFEEVHPVETTETSGKVDKILAWGNELRPRHWRIRCNWHFGRGHTAYITAPSVVNGTKCRTQFI